MIRIGLDARTLTMPQPRGIGISLRDVYQRLPALRPEWEFVFYHQRPVDKRLPDRGHPWQHPNVRLRHIDMPGDRFDAWFQIRLPLSARADHIDLLHLPANVAPAWCPVPHVTTIHDLIPLKVAGEATPAVVRAYRRGVLRAVRHSRHIIAISESTRRDLHRDLGAPLERITTLRWPPDLRMVNAMREPFGAAERRPLRTRYGLGPRWLISFSGRGRRKNARGLLDGFARVPSHRRRGVQVVLVGCEPAAVRERLCADAERLGIASDCRILGYVPDADVPSLIRGSAGLLIPSFYEGFGWPLLDAFVCGVPALASDNSSMPEVGGDAVLYCDPHDPCTIAAGIQQLLDPPTARQLVERGQARLSLFDREQHIAAMCGIFEQSLGAWAGARRGARRGENLLTTEGLHS